jgi:hypothetical protein
MDAGIESRKEQPGSEQPSGRSVTAIAVVIVVAVIAVVALAVSWFWPLSSTESMELSAGADDTMASCIAFSPAELANVADIAFEGTVAEVDGPIVTLSVDEWFEGTGPDTVVLNAPEGMEALIGGIPFVAGEQYLVSAQDGNVNYCGFSGPSTPEYRSSFQQAFGA